MDASDGQRFLNKRNVDDLDNDDHWLWSRVDRIKRSINTVLGSENEETKSKSRVKRGWFDDWLPKTEAPSDSETTTTTTEFSLFNWGNTNNDEKTTEKATTKAPEEQQPASILHRAQSDDSRSLDGEDDDGNNEDDDNEIYDGSGGYTKIEETRTVYDTKLERFCKFVLNDFF